jgi:hypothetical protein
VDYEAYWGVSTHREMDGTFTKRINRIFASGEAMSAVQSSMASAGLVPDPTIAYTFDYTSAFHRWNSQTGGVVKWNTPLSGLMVGASYYAYDINFGMDVSAFFIMPNAGTGTTVNSAVDGHVTRDITNWFGTYNWKQFKLSGEYATTKSSLIANGADRNSPDSEYMYVMLDYRFNSKLTFSTFYDIQYPDADVKDGDYTTYQKDWNVSVRYDVTSNWLVKGDVHMINGVSGNSGATEEDWMILVLKNTFYF